MKTWKDFQNEHKKCLESFDEFKKYVVYKKKSDWDKMYETVENAQGKDLDELLTEKEKFSQVETMDPAYQWMMCYMKYDDKFFTINFACTLDELEKKKLIKTETAIKDENKKYFEGLIKIAGECIMNGKKYKTEKDRPGYIANNKKYRFFIELTPDEWKFGIQTNTQQDILSCLKDVFDTWSDKLDIELTSFDENIMKWISDKVSNKLY